MLTKIITKALAGPFVSVLDKFIPDATERDKFILELEKTRMGVLSSLIERGSIPAILYLWLVLVFNKCLFSPWLGWFLNRTIPVFEIPAEITDLVKYLTIALLGKKVIDKKIKK